MQGHLAALASRLGLLMSRATESSKRRLGELQISLERYHPEKLWQSMQIRVDTAAMDLIRGASRIQASIQQARLRQNLALHEIQGQLRLNFQILYQRLGELRLTLGTLGQARQTEIRNRLEKAKLNLRNLSPLSVLERGYSLVMRGNRIVSSVLELSPGDELSLRLKDGAADVGVQKVKPDEEPSA
jgi:exodeoxyribonuclease VII large subunit